MGFKIEKGNKYTDWTPAPEDIDSDIQDVNEIASNAQSTANNALNRANGAYTEIDSINSTISNIVKDDNGIVFCSSRIKWTTNRYVTSNKKTK